MAITTSGIQQSEFYLEVARGNIAGMTGIQKFGKNLTFTAGEIEDIWLGGGERVYLTAPETLSVQSSSAKDDGVAPGSSGLHSVFILGLDENYNEIEETVVLTGTTPVITANEYLRVYRMYGLEVGREGTNVGVVTAYPSVTGEDAEQIEIAAGEGQSQISHYTIPAGKTGYFVGFQASIFPILIKTDDDTDPDPPSTGLMFSPSPDRVPASPLQDAVLNGVTHIFLDPSITAVRRVVFRLNGELARQENHAPYDFGGTAVDGTANGFDTSTLPDGVHQISAEVRAVSGGVTTLHATFEVSASGGGEQPENGEPRIRDSSGELLVFIRTQPDHSWRVVKQIALSTNGTTTTPDVNYAVPEAFMERTDIRMAARVSTDRTGIYCQYNLILVDN